MAQVVDLLSRVRLELGDPVVAFQSQVVTDGVTNRFELPSAPVNPATFQVLRTLPNAPSATILGNSEVTLDAENGVFTVAATPAIGTSLVAKGEAFKYFSDAELSLFLSTAVTQHLHNRQGITLATLPVVEEYMVVLLTVIEAMYALLNDAAFDIDVSTPEGVGIPRSQRFRQLQEMIEARKAQYAEMAASLNVGLNRIEMFNLRRVSRTTGRLVPVYIPQEIEDRQPPQRVFAPIDTLGGNPQSDPRPAVLDIMVYEYGYFTQDITLGVDVTGWKVDARIRRYKDSSSLREFTVTIVDAATGHVTLDLTPTQTGLLPQHLFWDLRLTNRATREVQTLRKGDVSVIQQVGVDEAIGPVAQY